VWQAASSAQRQRDPGAAEPVRRLRRVDPTDPDTIVLASLGGSSDSRPAALRSFSRDGGSTRTKVGGLPGNFGSFSPSVAFDAFGNCFLALVHDPDFGNPRLELFVSTADDDRKQAPVSPSPRS
jgi:hypothetical protein